MRRIAFLFALCAAPFPVIAASTPRCVDSPPLAEPWTSWTQSGDAIAGGEADGAPRLVLGKPVVARLRPASQVQFPVMPAKPQAKSHGGLFLLALKVPARVGIGLSGPAWVDVVTGRSAAASVDHGHGAKCSGIRKIVWFDLLQGQHVVQISNAPAREIRIMATDAQANQPIPRGSDKPF